MDTCTATLINYLLSQIYETRNDKKLFSFLHFITFIDMIFDVVWHIKCKKRCLGVSSCTFYYLGVIRKFCSDIVVVVVTVNTSMRNAIHLHYAMKKNSNNNRHFVLHVYNFLLTWQVIFVLHISYQTCVMQSNTK